MACSNASIGPGAYPEEGVHCVRDYELGIVVSPEASEEQTKAILDRMTQIVQTNGGQVVKVNAWGRRRLAYPIEHHRDGLYFFLDLALTPQTVVELDRNLKVTEEVIRHLLVKRDPKALAAQRAKEAHAAAALPDQEASVNQEEPLPQPEEDQEAADVSGALDEEPGSDDEADLAPDAEEVEEVEP
jgi:small subunit ribosomal protein S6